VANQDLENEISELQINLEQLVRKQAETEERLNYLREIGHPSQRESSELRIEKMRLALKGINAEKQAQQQEANRMSFLAGRELISQRQNEYAQLQARLSEMKEAEQQGTLVELQHDYNTLQKSQGAELQRLSHEIAQNNLEIEKLRLHLSIQENKRSLSEIYAPADGFISLGQEGEKLVGQYIRTGEKLADLISTQSMIFIAAIPESEVRKLREGQTVNLELNALPYQKFKVFKGQVVQIPPTTEKDKTTGAAIYRAKIKLEDFSVQLNETDQPTTFNVMPGFSGIARIIVRSDLQFITYIKKQIFG
jgi:multidrug resistance efflux pump